MANNFSAKAKHKQSNQYQSTQQNQSSRQERSNWQQHKPKQRRSLSQNTQLIFLMLLFGVAGILIFLNLKPYIEVAQQIVPQLARIDFLTLLTEIPLIGGLFSWLLSTVGRFTASIVGIVFWGLIQTAQIAPLVWRADLDVLGSSIRGVEKHRYFQPSELDPEALAKLKRLNNEAPSRFVRFWDSASLIAYLCETAIVSFRFPPYQGGWDAILADFGVWDAAKFDWLNALMMILTMFGFEVVVRVGLWFYQRRYYFS